MAFHLQGEGLPPVAGESPGSFVPPGHVAVCFCRHSVADGHVRAMVFLNGVSLCDCTYLSMPGIERVRLPQPH